MGGHHHGSIEHRGFNEAAKTSHGRVRSKRFANRFAGLEPYDRSPEFLDELGSVRVENDALVGPMLGETGASDDATVSAGMAFFAQFIDHEITFDPTSGLDRRNDPRALRNFRTPALDLDSLYGGGAEVRPFLYDSRDADGAKLLTGPAAETPPTDESAPRAERFGATDVQRNDQGDAMIVDPRNDENVIISQLLLAFMKFHNRVVDYVRSGDGHDEVAGGGGEEIDVYEEAGRLVRWHYQWLAVNEFLPQVCDNYVVNEIRSEGPEYFIQPDSDVAIPIEFAGAAYRYGHSQIRDRYTVNSDSTDVQFFPGPAPEDMADVMKTVMEADEPLEGPPPGVIEEATSQHLNGFRPIPDELVVEWPYFFDHAADGGDADALQYSRKIDAELSPALFLLPFIGDGPRSLAARNLRRGAGFGIPSGQRLARAMEIEPLDNDALPLGEGRSFGDYLESVHRGGDSEAPPWLYILAEAEAQNDGERLGRLGSRIVGEVIYGLIQADERTYLNAATDWQPTLPRPATDDSEDTSEPGYTFADLFTFATGPTPDGLQIHAVDADGEGAAPDTPADDPTGGEAVILEHTGTGKLPIDGYELDLEEQSFKLSKDGEMDRLDKLEPGNRLVVYTGDGPADDPDVRTFAAERNVPMIASTGEPITVMTPTGEVSDFVTFQS